MDEKKKNVRRPLDERLAEFDKKIKYHEDCIKSLKTQRQQAIDIANKPKQRKPKQFRRLVLDGNVSADLLKERFGISNDDFEQFLNEVREALPKD